MTLSSMSKATWGAWALLLWLSACGGLVSGKPTAGGESHFLEPCSSGCGALDCIANVCTRSCLGDQTSCEDLSPLARCRNVGLDASGEAVCDVGCAESADCRTLGASFACVDDYCRSSAPSEPATKPPSSGAGASSSEGSTERADVCSLPFDAGNCEALQRVYTAVDGICMAAAYGGCERDRDGDDKGNRFSTLEDCVATCENHPRTDCSAASEPQRVCVECAPTGGCARYDTICRQSCSEGYTACQQPGFACIGNQCQLPDCF